jgi:hypothetical protein
MIYNADVNITKEDFLKYEVVLVSGVTNMFNVSVVHRLSGLSKDQIIDIMAHYAAYSEKYLKSDDE